MKFPTKNGVRFGVRRQNRHDSYRWFSTLHQPRLETSKSCFAILLVLISLSSISSIHYGPQGLATVLPRVSAAVHPMETNVNPANSSTSIILYPSSGLAGSTVDVSGSGFSTSDTTCSLYGTPVTSSALCSMTSGTLNGTFTVASVASGVYTVRAIGKPSHDHASAQFTVLPTTYSATFAESGIPSGVMWGVTVNGLHPSTSSSTSILVSGLYGTVSYSYDSPVSGSGGSYTCTSGCVSSVSSATTLRATYTFQSTSTTTSTASTSSTGSSGSGYLISFYPASDWECGEDIQVTFQGPLTEGGHSGHPIQFVYYQYSSSNEGALSPLWTDTQYATTGDTITYPISASEWGGFDYSTLPFIYVIVQDIDVPTNSPPIILTTEQTGIEPFSCGSGSGYVGYTTYGNCADWEAGQCVDYGTTTEGINIGGQGTTQLMSTQTMSLTTTSNIYSTLSTTTTGYATTQVSTTVTSETSYVTEVVHSYGTVTATQYVYVESSNSTPSVYPANSASTGPGSNLFNPGVLGSLMSGNSISSPFLLLVGSGAAVAVLVSALVMRRRRGGRGLEKSVSPSEVDETLLNYITDHNGAISVAKASKDLGMSTEDVGEAIMRLRADGKLQGG